jgi:preprotein translocase subunit Sec63
MPPAFDPYEVLQVVPSCEQKVIHAAFRALALKWLSRHSSGIRYRTEIYAILGTMGRTAA